MWIRMISTAAGPRLPHGLESGKVYQVEDELGRELVEILAAKEVPAPSDPKQPPAENASDQSIAEKAIIEDGGKKPESLMEKLKPGKKNGSAEK